MCKLNCYYRAHDENDSGVKQSKFIKQIICRYFILIAKSRVNLLRQEDRYYYMCSTIFNLTIKNKEPSSASVPHSVTHQCSLTHDSEHMACGLGTSGNNTTAGGTSGASRPLSAAATATAAAAAAAKWLLASK